MLSRQRSAFLLRFDCGQPTCKVWEIDCLRSDLTYDVHEWDWPRLRDGASR